MDLSQADFYLHIENKTKQNKTIIPGKGTKTEREISRQDFKRMNLQ